MEKYGENFDYIELGKLAIDYSDAIVKTSDRVSKELINYATQQKKLILNHPAEDKISEEYNNFYEQLLG
jgi:starch synthase